MRVLDIKSDASQVLGYCTDSTLYNRLTHAVEVLSNKGNWDSMTAYMDITVGSGNVVTLPRDVEIPIRLNINNNPSFSRPRLYEFSLDGPGNDMQDTSGYNWLDKGEVSVIGQPPATSTIKAVSHSSSDNGKSITIWGKDADGREITDNLILNSVTPPTSANSYKEITRVIKDATVSTVELKDTTSNTQLSNYYPDETEPLYRQIRLTKTAASIRMLYRRRTYTISSDADYIPLQSRMAILMMLKALEAFRNGSQEDVQKGQFFEAQALKFLKEEQDSRNNFDIVQTTEDASILDLNYNNADSIIVADVYDDAAKIFGPVGRQKLFDLITESLELLHNKGIWDGLEGYVDLITDNAHYITLPRYVETPIAINVNGTPKSMRNKWFEFHLNGPGSDPQGSCAHWDFIGDVVTIRPLPTIMQFTYKPDRSEDDGKILTIYGYDENNKWIRSQVGGAWQDGFQVVADHAGALPLADSQKVTKIERITRASTTGFAQLIGYNEAQTLSIQFGYYYPDETEPKYIRIRLPYRAAWIRMRYRKRMIKIGSLTDPIHLKSKLSVMAAMRATKAMLEGDFEKGEAWEQKAIQYLQDEQSSRNPAETFNLQIEGFEDSFVV